MRILLCILAVCGITSVACSQNFRGYPCTVDCSGHEAGYEWAERRGIDSADDCGGSSNSFIEGCQAYVEEQLEDEDQDQVEDGEADE